MDDRYVLKPIQPYFVNQTQQFYQEIYRRQGISHFYTFQLKSGTEDIYMVPDGCVDLLFIYGRTRMKAKIVGITLSAKEQLEIGEYEYFGIRFFPGIIPAGITIASEDLVERQLDLEAGICDYNFLKNMAQKRNFHDRITCFLSWYTKQLTSQNMQSVADQTVDAVFQMIYRTDGNVMIKELEEYTGYTARYLNKLFHMQTGVAPKTFCKIIQFQRSLEKISYDPGIPLADVAVDLGYYDQAQFIRDFKHYCNMTPRQYRTWTVQREYQKKIVTTSIL